MTICADGTTPVADEGSSDADEGKNVLGHACVAAVQATAAGKPGHGSLDHPTMTAQPLAALDTLTGNAVTDAPC